MNDMDPKEIAAIFEPVYKRGKNPQNIVKKLSDIELTLDNISEGLKYLYNNGKIRLKKGKMMKNTIITGGQGEKVAMIYSENFEWNN